MLEEIEKNIDYGDVYDKKADIVELLNIINKAIEYIEENSFEDTTGVVLNLSDESYWSLWKILKGESDE